MSLRLEPVSETFVVYASGVDLREPQDADTIAALQAALEKHAVLIFRGLDLTQAQQLAFTKQMGPLETVLYEITKNISTRMEFPDISDISNLDQDGNVCDREYRQYIEQIANRIWHTDNVGLPWRYSMLYAVTAVEKGGETQFADLRGAYDGLDEADKAYFATLTAEHNVGHVRDQLGYTAGSPEERDMAPTVRWPLIRTHPGTGRKVLYAVTDIREIVGMPVPEGRQLVSELVEHCTQPQFVFTHKWRPGDFVIWDNRLVMHRGKRFDMTQRREMRRTQTQDDVMPEFVTHTALAPKTAA